ncbi:MAG: O-antigen ligase family protein, partial [Planctomycetes bacterium]|nr:O-antigen ligase family protein [Planctomycetota bacterium]
MIRPCLGLAFYLFLVYLQPEWNWRWTTVADIQYQKYVVACILIGWIISGLKQYSFRPWFTWSFLSLLSFIALAAVSNSFSERPVVSSVYFDVLWKTAVVALLIAKLPTNSNEVLWLTGAMLLGAEFNAFKINEDYFLTGIARFARSGWGLKGDNNVYTLFTLPFLVCSCALIFVLKNKLSKTVAVIAAVLMVHQVMLLESRGGFLGAILSVGILICFVRKTTWTIVALAVGAVVVGILAGPPVIEEFSSIFESEEQRDSSAASRLTLWKAASKIALDHPILGVGPNLGQFYIPRYVESYRDLETKHPHNFFLEVASGCGIPALLFLVFFMTVPVFVVLSRRR